MTNEQAHRLLHLLPRLNTRKIHIQDSHDREKGMGGTDLRILELIVKAVNGEADPDWVIGTANAYLDALVGLERARDDAARQESEAMNTLREKREALNHQTED